MTRKATSLDQELKAVRDIHKILTSFDCNAQQRILQHATEYLSDVSPDETPDPTYEPIEGERPLPLDENV